MSNTWYQRKDGKHGFNYNLIPTNIELPYNGNLLTFYHRGPAVDYRNTDYITCIGAAQTFGRYVKKPFP